MFVTPNIKKDKKQYQIIQENVVVIACLSNCISTVYYDSLLYKVLQEKYTPLKLNPDNIKDSLLVVINKCQTKNKLKDEDILNELNTEFLKGKMTFEISSLNLNDYKYPNSGIAYAEANNLIYIYVLEKFFDILRSVDILKSDLQLDNLSKDIYKIYTHEITRVHQFNRQKQLQFGIEPEKIVSKLDRANYLSHYREIDAHAREFAANLLDSDLSFDEIKKALQTRDPVLSKYKIYREYYRALGSCEKMSKSQLTKRYKDYIKAFKHFLKRTYDFLLLDKHYINDDENIFNK